MYYIIGKVISLNENLVIVEDKNGIAYQGINIFEKDEGIDAQIGMEKKIFLIQYWNEFELNLLFFNNEELRNLFCHLLKIKQIGIKTAQSIFLTFKANEFIEIVKTYDVASLQQIKGMGSITAKIIIDELNKAIFNLKMTQKQEKILQTLQRLGYRMSAVYQVLKTIDRKLPEEQMLDKSIRLLSANAIK